MPRRSVLSATERESLFTIPAVGDELISAKVGAGKFRLLRPLPGA